MNAKIKDLLSKLTLEEKAGLCSGKDWWRTKPVERLGIPSVMVSDGPAGLRTQAVNGKDENDSITAVCFPSGCATAASFDRQLLEHEGQLLGNEANAMDVSVLLGPAINIKRSPLCGRNFEYLSEDPYLAGELASAYVKGVQSQNVGVSVKHFAANNQEFRRFSVSEKIDERSLREIYLPAFETVVKTAKPKNIMCSYNAINGTLSSENEWLLNDVLRKEWGFDGFVVSDWGAVNDRVKGIKAGLNLEMPYSGGITDSYIVQAVKDGNLSMERLDEVVADLLNFILEYTENKKEGKWDKEKDHLASAEIAAESCVLLKNENDLLPLSKEEADAGKILFVGEFAKVPRFEGGGSSNIKTYKVTGALEAAKELGFNVEYIDGNDIKAAEEAAKKASSVVIFAGLPDIYESEGFDRDSLDMPESHNQLIEAIAQVNPNVAVVLHNGAPVTMPWVDKVSSILECYLGGEAVGLAQAKILFGLTNPSGKLPETFPLRLEDTPCYLNFPGNGRTVTYAEGIYVGYRWYDSRKMPVLFPFGHGLSYTSFDYGKVELSCDSMSDDQTVDVTVSVKNSGSVDGKEVVQLYVRDLTGAEARPDKELKGFQKIFLKAGQEKEVTFTLSKRSFAYWNSDINDWYAPSGEYEILIGASSRDIRDSAIINIKSTTKKAFEITRWTTPGDMLNNAEMKPIITDFIVKNYGADKINEVDENSSNVAFSQKTMREMYLNDPFRSLRGRNGRTDADVNKIVKDFNKALE
ncbi:MAG: glycoside hydrolase family 3 C-terminal domain-containing protein [Treponema sp.]|nr:glycoside hydrolase family 3 C-terminal domain-containing protein [Treponema sp.]